MSRIYGEVNFVSGNLSMKDCGNVYKVYGDKIFCILGRIKTGGGINSIEDISRLYLENGIAITEQLGGTYILVIFDQKKNELLVFHDRTTSPVTMYYLPLADKLFFGTSLKSLLHIIPAPRAFAEGQIEEFLCNGYLYNEETLVEGIYKIKAFHALHATKEEVKQIPVSYREMKMNKGDALNAFKETLDRAIVDCFVGEKEINLPLSSGYDSSYIVHIANEKGAIPINAFSVGGKFGKNELPLVEENIKSFPKANLVSALTDENTLQHMPDIVWRLEGNVFESGIFLQYELAKHVSKAGKNYLICGECADQVLNENYLRNDRVFPEKQGYYEFSEYPYIFGSYLILKKNGILFNSFGIETRYPYLSDEFVDIAWALRYENGKDKRCHVANCREHLPKLVIQNISKIGGSTDCHSLFAGKNEINTFFNEIERSDLYRQNISLVKKYFYSEQQKQSGLKRVKTIARNIILNALGINKAGREADVYFNEEIKLRDYLKIMYLILFETLFLSGKYDDQFAEEEIKDELKSF